MLQAVTEATFAVVDSRLQYQHRLLVATCFCLVSLNMACLEEDYVKAFLVPLNFDQAWLWEGIVPIKHKKEVFDDDEQEKDKGDVEEMGKEEEKKDKSESRLVDAMERHDDQADETFPSWLPHECSKKVCCVVQLNSFRLCSMNSISNSLIDGILFHSSLYLLSLNAKCLLLTYINQ